MVVFDAGGSIRQRPRNNQLAQQEGGTTKEQEEVQGEAMQQPANLLPCAALI
jgi:hypothetical protein